MATPTLGQPHRVCTFPYPILAKEGRQTGSFKVVFVFLVSVNESMGMGLYVEGYGKSSVCGGLVDGV